MSKPTFTLSLYQLCPLQGMDAHVAAPGLQRCNARQNTVAPEWQLMLHSIWA